AGRKAMNRDKGVIRIRRNDTRRIVWRKEIRLKRTGAGFEIVGVLPDKIFRRTHWPEGASVSVTFQMHNMNPVDLFLCKIPGGLLRTGRGFMGYCFGSGVGLSMVGKTGWRTIPTWSNNFQRTALLEKVQTGSPAHRRSSDSNLEGIDVDGGGRDGCA